MDILVNNDTLSVDFGMPVLKEGFWAQIRRGDTDMVQPDGHVRRSILSNLKLQVHGLQAAEPQGNCRLGGTVKWTMQKKIWAGMTKVQSSLLMQIRTGHIGLKTYLFSRWVPGITTPWCSCGEGREIMAHLILDCNACGRPPDLRSRRDLEEAITDPD